MNPYLPRMNSALSYTSPPPTYSTSQPSTEEPYSSAIDQNANETLSGVKENSIFLNERESIAPNFQDIHGNYAKRRYKNVESKVGRYIASIRAEERKRRAAKFAAPVRSNSAPLSYIMPKPMVTDDGTNAEESQQHKVYSTDDLDKLHESMDTEVMTSSACSSSTHGGGASSNGASRHESSDDAVNGTDFIDKQIYAQIVFEKEHLQNLLDEKRTECVRHKRNVEFLRIELTNCQDELKRARTTSSGLNLRHTSDFIGFSYGARTTYPSSLQRLNSAPAAFETKATQTDLIMTTENLGTPKRRATNENILRRRTNSNSFTQKLENAGQRRPHGYDEMDNIYNTKMRKLQAAATPPASPAASAKTSPSHSDYTYYAHNQTYSSVPTRSASPDLNVFEEQAQNGNQKRQRFATKSAETRHHSRKSTFRQRLNRLFSRCTRCDDPNQSLDAYGQSYQENEIEMQSPTPLLARSEASQHQNTN